MQAAPQWLWTAFGASLLFLLALDLFSHRRGKKDTRTWAVLWTIIWISAGLGFAIFVWIVLGHQHGGEFIAAYLIEESLSVDNMFVFLVIFKTLSIPRANRRTALTWGIFGALIFRAVFIFAGSAAIHQWSWVNYIFGAILLITAFHTFREDSSESEDSRLVHWLSVHLPVSKDTNSRRFIIRNSGIKATPLLVSIIALELTDILFAMDSVPAAFSVTKNTFLIYSSNAFAILGLRSLFSVIAEFINGMRFLHYGLAAVLAFAGVKIMFSETINLSPFVSVAIIVLIVALSVFASILMPESPNSANRKPHHNH
jgi:tellurite resistance protein TerC